MEVTRAINVEPTIKAVLRETGLTVTLTVAAPYGDGRAVSVSVEEFPPELVEAAEEALTRLMESRLDQAVIRATNAAYEAATVAARQGEL